MGWFKPKSHGYGAAPSNWKGWAAILAFVAIEIVLALIFIVRPVMAETGPSFVRFLAWCAISGAVTVVFIKFTMARTDGVWRWRWGEME